MGASDRGPKLRDEGGGTKTKSKGKSSKSRKNATRGGTTVIREGNNVPKDEDIIGGEAGKTFTTTSHVKVPTWYAKVREERGND